MDIKTLRKITQEGKVEGRERPWLYKSMQRGPSVYITNVLIRTSITPNTVSIFSILSGLIGFGLFLSPTGYIGLIVGILFFYLNILLDKVDGEVARYKKLFSLKGIFLDNINHLLIPALFFMGLTLHVGLYRGGLLLPVLVAGFLGAISMSVIRTGWSLPAQIYAKKYLKHPELFDLPESSKTPVEEMKESFHLVRKVLYVLHQFQEFFMVLLVFLIVVLIEALTQNILVEYFLIIFGIFLFLVFIENTTKGYLSIDSRVKELRDRFSGK